MTNCQDRSFAILSKLVMVSRSRNYTLICIRVTTITSHVYLLMMAHLYRRHQTHWIDSRLRIYYPNRRMLMHHCLRIWHLLIGGINRSRRRMLGILRRNMKSWHLMLRLSHRHHEGKRRLTYRLLNLTHWYQTRQNSLQLHQGLLLLIHHWLRSCWSKETIEGWPKWMGTISMVDLLCSLCIMTNQIGKLELFLFWAMLQFLNFAFHVFFKLYDTFLLSWRVQSVIFRWKKDPLIFVVLWFLVLVRKTGSKNDGV